MKREDRGTVDLRRITAQIRRTEKQEKELYKTFIDLVVLLLGEVGEGTIIKRGNGSVIKIDANGKVTFFLFLYKKKYEGISLKFCCKTNAPSQTVFHVG